jgi:hypothetical protein
MAQWYNGVFYTEAEEPKKDDDFIPHSIPRIQEYDIENIEDIEQSLKSKFDFAFIDKFSFKGLPTGLDEQKKFLENSANTREANPAGLKETTLNFAQTRNTINTIKSAIGTTATHYLTGARDWVKSWSPWAETKANITKGGRKTKKARSQKNQKRTQRRLLTVDDR